MMARSLIAILVATLVIASGAAGSFYLAGAQERAAAHAEITLSITEARPGSEIDVDGSGFGADAEVSIYSMSAGQASMTNGSAFIL